MICMRLLARAVVIVRTRKSGCAALCPAMGGPVDGRGTEELEGRKPGALVWSVFSQRQGGCKMDRGLGGERRGRGVGGGVVGGDKGEGGGVDGGRAEVRVGGEEVAGRGRRGRVGDEGELRGEIRRDDRGDVCGRRRHAGQGRGRKEEEASKRDIYMVLALVGDYTEHSNGSTALFLLERPGHTTATTPEPVRPVLVDGGLDNHIVYVMPHPCPTTRLLSVHDYVPRVAPFPAGITRSDHRRVFRSHAIPIYMSALISMRTSSGRTAIGPSLGPAKLSDASPARNPTRPRARRRRRRTFGGHCAAFTDLRHDRPGLLSPVGPLSHILHHSTIGSHLESLITAINSGSSSSCVPVPCLALWACLPMTSHPACLPILPDYRRDVGRGYSVALDLPYMASLVIHRRSTQNIPCLRNHTKPSLYLLVDRTKQALDDIPWHGTFHGTFLANTLSRRK